MEAFTVLEGPVAPLDRTDVDTDALLPKQFMKSIARSGFGRHLFDAWRYLDEGYPGKPAAERRPDPDFVLNQPRYRDAPILLTRENFGCGSSREHALWALVEYGFRAILAPSFGDIFHDNCFKNGVLPIRLPASRIDALFVQVAASEDFRLTVDLAAEELRLPDGSRWAFKVDPFRRHCLLHGLDDIALTLQRAEEIRRYEARRRLLEPWLFVR